MLVRRPIASKAARISVLVRCFSDPGWTEALVIEAQSRLMQDRITAFSAATVKEHERLIEIQRYGMKHCWYKVQGQLEQRLDKQEKRQLQACRKCQAAQRQLNVVQNKVCLSQKYLQQLQDAYEEHTKNKRGIE